MKEGIKENLSSILIFTPTFNHKLTHQTLAINLLDECYWPESEQVQESGLLHTTYSEEKKQET